MHDYAQVSSWTRTQSSGYPCPSAKKPAVPHCRRYLDPATRVFANCNGGLLENLLWLACAYQDVSTWNRAKPKRIHQWTASLQMLHSWWASTCQWSTDTPMRTNPEKDNFNLPITIKIGKQQSFYRILSNILNYAILLATDGDIAQPWQAQIVRNDVQSLYLLCVYKQGLLPFI